MNGPIPRFIALYSACCCLNLLLASPRDAQTPGTITTVAGIGDSAIVGDGGPATLAGLMNPSGVFVDGAGNLYIADLVDNRVRKVDPSGVITTVVGNGTRGFAGDGGPATQAHLSSPIDVFVDGGGNLYIADLVNNRVRKVDPSGVITTVAGNGTRGFAGDGGPATQAHLVSPGAVFVDSTGNLYIADRGNNRIRKVDPAGNITTVAGNGSEGFSGDGGPATQASLFFPLGVSADGGGNLYIADLVNTRVRKVDPAGIITTVAGNGTFSFSGDGGPATQASLGQLNDVSVDRSGNLYIADTHNNRIRKVDSAGIITTVVGNGIQGYAGDGGLATRARLNGPEGVFVDDKGHLYIADTENKRIRRVEDIASFTPSGDFEPAIADTISPRIIASSPRDGALDIDPEEVNRQGIWIAFSEPLDTALVLVHFQAEERLLDWHFFYSPGDSLLTLRPGSGDELNFGTVYHLTLSQVRDKAGNVADDTTLTFTTQPSFSDTMQTAGAALVFKIFSLVDVPNDQGRHLRILWNKHPNDTLDEDGYTLITTYSVWRQIDPDLPAIRAKVVPDSTGTPAGGWDFITTVPAHQSDEYSVVVPTLADSTATGGVYYSTFFVQAHTVIPNIHYSTAPDSGYSVDNLEPHTPPGFALSASGTRAKLVWEQVPDEDLAYYAVYRGASPGFEPEAAYRTTTDTILEDSIDEAVRFYRIAAFDFAGNQSPPSEILEALPEGTEPLRGDFDNNGIVDLADFFLFADVFGGSHLLYDLDDSGAVDFGDFFLFADNFGEEAQAKLIALAQEYIGLPVSLRLDPSYPNPFNSSTVIPFVLPANGAVELAIYNLMGQKVANLAKGAYKAGVYRVRWDGRDDHGRDLASGIYLSRLLTNKQVEVRKLLLLR